jgi:2-polyprenyl-3-methyl-5-hydroxy-6-metoxy-1,4-benzoquinol methylase
MSPGQDFATANSISDFLQLWLTGRYLDGVEKEIFERYYASYMRHFGPYIQFHYRSQTRELFEALAPCDKSTNVLEIGCGCGTESLWLALQGYSVKGVDLMDDLLQVARKRKSLLTQMVGRELRCEFENRSLLDLENQHHDVIWMEQTFHHLEPRSEVLTKLSALLRPGGKLVISETNGWNPAIQMKYFRLRGLKTVIEVQGAPWGNERILSANALGRLLRRHGIRQTKLRHFRIFPNKRWADWLTSYAGVFDDTDSLLLRPLYTHYNYVGVKE